VQLAGDGGRRSLELPSNLADPALLSAPERDLLPFLERQVPRRGWLDDAVRCDGRMPPASRNHRPPTAGETPTLTAASSLELPVAIAAQNNRCSRRRATKGRPGDRSFARPARSDRRLRVVIATLPPEVLRRPIEFTLPATIAMMDELAVGLPIIERFSRASRASSLRNELAARQPTMRRETP